MTYMKRRTLLTAGFAAGLLLPAGSLFVAAGQARAEVTPACGAATPEQTEGPYFTPNAPLKTDLHEPGMKGEQLRMAGRVLDSHCRPVSRALLEVWQADADGVYDNRGYRLRGHVFADEAGGWMIDTIRPGRYPGRTPHIHVKVKGPTTRLLTTQLYFPNDPGNARDGIYDPRLLLQLEQRGEGLLGRYDFVLS
ncbi:intradiol ring-cleavage dioxygenase [Ferrovibrio sp.]|uniref:dioxygenase family protein n=1 Tax=Ferrovibrio sp. TaxID=1917215 RepID=UPI0035B4A84F